MQWAGAAHPSALARTGPNRTSTEEELQHRDCIDSQHFVRRSLRVDAVVVGVASGPKGPVIAPGAEAVDKAFDGKLAAILETLGASGGEGEVTKLPAPAGFKAPVVLAVGLGEAPTGEAGYQAESLRRAAGAPARTLAGAKKAGLRAAQR